jgi:hypothetical protein
MRIAGVKMRGVFVFGMFVFGGRRRMLCRRKIEFRRRFGGVSVARMLIRRKFETAQIKFMGAGSVFVGHRLWLVFVPECLRRSRHIPRRLVGKRLLGAGAFDQHQCRWQLRKNLAERVFAMA